MTEEDEMAVLLSKKSGLELPEVVVIITEDVFTSERAYAGLRYAVACRSRGDTVHLVLFGKSIDIAMKKNMSTAVQDKWENKPLWLDEFHELGGLIYACNCYCVKHHILQQDLLRYVPITQVRNLVDIMNNSKIHLTF